MSDSQETPQGQGKEEQPKQAGLFVLHLPLNLVCCHLFTALLLLCCLATTLFSQLTR